jgi:hypothetical protein
MKYFEVKTYLAWFTCSAGADDALFSDLLAGADVKVSQVYMAWTVKSDESIRVLERTSDSEKFH